MSNIEKMEKMKWNIEKQYGSDYTILNLIKFMELSIELHKDCIDKIAKLEKMMAEGM